MIKHKETGMNPEDFSLYYKKMRPQSFSDTKVVYLLAELKIDIPSFLAEPLA